MDRKQALKQGFICARVVKLVDMMDSKSIAFAGVPVRVRPLVPLLPSNKPNGLFSAKHRGQNIGIHLGYKLE